MHITASVKHYFLLTNLQVLEGAETMRKLFHDVSWEEMSLFFQFLKPVQSEVVALSQRGVQVCMPCSQRRSTVLTQSLTVQGNLATPWNAGLQLAGRYVGVIKCKCSCMRIKLIHWTFKLRFWFREEYYQVLVLQRTECTKVEVCMGSEKQLNQMGLLSPLPSTKTMSLPMLFPMNRKICVIFSTLQQCSMYRNISVPSLFWFSLQWRKQFWLVQLWSPLVIPFDLFQAVFSMFVSHSCIATEALLMLHLELKSYFICPKCLLIYSGMISLSTSSNVSKERQVLLQINQTHSFKFRLILEIGKMTGWSA